jgi:DNA-binding GntR family transcriptional regulator
MSEVQSKTTFRSRDAGKSGAGHVFETLREEIISLARKPGAILSRQDLQTRFGFSSTPIRDALLKLQEEGLVHIFPQHATVVSPIDIERARQGQFLRRSLETEIVRDLAVNPDPGLVERLRASIRRQAAFAGLNDIPAFSEEDLAFHRMMYEACGVDDLWYLMRRQSGHIDRLRRLHLPREGKMREIIAAHTAIVDAIAEGAVEPAQVALRDHLSRSLQFVDTLRETHPQFFE